MHTQTPIHLTHNISQIPMGDNTTVFKCRFKLAGNFSANTNKHIIIALDNSGSMGGSAMNYSKIAIKELLNYLHQGGIKNISLISYNSKARIEFLPQSSLQDRLNIVDSIVAHDRTSFCDAFDKIKEVMQAVPSKEVCVIFFTDGQDTCDEERVIGENLNNLASYIKKTTAFSETHTIGFTSSHDALLLSKITTIGKNTGTFQYCKSSVDIPMCVDSIAGLIGGQTITAHVILPGSTERVPLELEESTKEGDDREFETLFFVKKEILDKGSEFDLAINVDSEKIFQSVKFADVKMDEEGKMGILTLQIGLIKSEVNKLVKEATNMKFDKQFDPKVLESILKRLDKEEQNLDNTLKDLGKGLKTSHRKDIYPLAQEVREQIIEFYAALRGFQKGQISNDAIANLNALAYKGITKKGLQKKLDKRTQQNVNLINDVYEKVNKIVEGYDMNHLRTKYSELSDKLGDCVLSCNSFIEALADEDCLCLAFDIGRSQAAIADPTQVVIKNVFPSFLTAGSFLYSAQFALKKNEKAHGGFEKYAEGLIVKGAAQENITGVMPLYICPENWKVAKLLMKPTLGWSVTLDPLGYAYSQMKIVPFMILAKLAIMVAQNPNSDFLSFQFKLVKETCMQIIRDGSNPNFENNFTEELKNLFENYIKDPAVRTTDIIANNSIFVCQLYCAIEAGLIEKKSPEDMKEFFKKMVEEELRRRQINWNSSSEIPENGGNHYGEIVDDIPTLLFKLLNIDTVKYVDEPVAEFFLKKKEVSADEFCMGVQSEYEKKFLQALAITKIANGGLEEKIQPSNPVVVNNNNQEERKTSDVNNNPHLKDFEPVKFEYSLKKNDNYNTSQGKALQEYQETLKKVMKYFSPLINLFGLEEFSHEKFKSWGIDNDTKFFTLYIQNKLQGKNHARREAISSKNYKDPWTQDEEFLQFWYARLVNEEKSKRITQFLNDIEGQKSDANATIFLNTSNVLEAAGAFMGTMIGKNLNHYYKKLAKSKAPLAKEKLEMMITGHYKGVRLYKDSEDWHPCRRNGNAIWRNLKTIMTAEEWKALIPSLSLRFVSGEAKCPPPEVRLQKKFAGKKGKK